MTDLIGRSYSVGVSTQEPFDSWDFVVSSEGDALLAELRRHGVAPGQRWHLTLLEERSSGATGATGRIRHCDGWLRWLIRQWRPDPGSPSEGDRTR